MCLFKYSTFFPNLLNVNIHTFIDQIFCGLEIYIRSLTFSLRNKTDKLNH